MPEPVKTVTTPVEKGTPPSEEAVKKSEALNKSIFDDFGDDEGTDEEGKVIETTTTPKKAEKVVETKEVSEEVEEEEKVERSMEERVASAVTEALTKARPEEKKVETPVELTEEQKDQLLSRFKPSEALLEMMDSDDKAVRLKAIQHLVDGTIKQALTMAKYLAEAEVEKVRLEFSPLKQQSQLSAEERGKQEFYDAYPGLKDEKYTPFLRLATEDLKKDGSYNPKSKDEAMKLIATRASEYAKRFEPNFELGTPAAKTTTTKAKTTIPKQPVTSAGGGGGTGSTVPTVSANRTNGTEIFD